jgi:ribosomal protein S18 acetylase RimI-like enzyme
MPIRTMTRADVEPVALLAGELGYPSSTRQMLRRIEALEGREGEHAIVAELDGAVVGWTHVRIIRCLESEPYAEIWGLVVSERARSRGIGSALVAECERWAQDRGLATIRLRSNVLRTRAHGLYERSGYRVVKQQKVFEKQLSAVSSASSVHQEQRENSQN